MKENKEILKSRYDNYLDFVDEIKKRKIKLLKRKNSRGSSC